MFVNSAPGVEEGATTGLEGELLKSIWVSGPEF